MVMKKNLFKILIVDDEAEHRDILEMILTSNNYITDTAPSAKTTEGSMLTWPSA